MAPIFLTAVGASPQMIDDPRLQYLLDTLNALPLASLPSKTEEEQSVSPRDVSELVDILEPWQTWVFEEQVDLQGWINPLNAIDAALSHLIRTNPYLLLISPVKRKQSRSESNSLDCLSSLRPADTVEETTQVPDTVISNLCVLVRFLSGLLRNAANKSVFNSVEELVDLLAASDDTLMSFALEALCNLATPPSLHKQQAPEVHQHSTSLHNSKTSSHRRLIAMARGWGSRGSGLGLFTCVTADDSEFGQGALPAQAGEINFAYFASKSAIETEVGNQAAQSDQSDLVRIHVGVNEMGEDVMQIEPPSGRVSTVEGNDTTMTEDGLEANKQKRRRLGTKSPRSWKTKSTAELFFLALEKAGGRDKIPEDRLFPLLADIRLASSFHSAATRAVAIERRLRALITILHSHPSQEIMSGYFQAQPELCVELIDLLRPTVSSASVSAASTKPTPKDTPSAKQDAIAALAECPYVPYSIRLLAVEALTALVARREGTGGALTGVARHSNVLNELGVGKGQYLGLLPTLIRYSLASLGSFLSRDQKDGNAETISGMAVETTNTATDNDETIEVGLAFLEATAPTPLPRYKQLERALELIDAVLTLTSAVVSAPSGTSALTDCGLIPSLLSTVAVDSQTSLKNVLPGPSSLSSEELLRIQSQLRFITAQAVQILEGAIVTHNNALSAFHELQGVEVLTTQLSKEIIGIRRESKKSSMSDSLAPMEVDSEAIEVSTNQPQALRSSQRVLLFSIVTCLTVVFHQESTSSAVSAPLGGTHLRKPELTEALSEIMENANSYGGHLVSLIATLLSDVMNSDPHVVHHVHKSGMAKSFLDMLLGEQVTGPGEEGREPVLPPVPELIMAIPNVISALALTEDGAKAVRESNPFPSLLRLFHHSKYAMPRSRCLLNEMTTIVGTGLDEVMRHVQSLRPFVLSAIADAMNQVVAFGEEVARREEEDAGLPPRGEKPPSSLENDRTCLMQYALNFGQLLEQILHNEDHCEPFVDAGGLDALIRLYHFLMPAGFQFLAHVSGLSSPSVSTLTHSTTEDTLSLAFKCIALRYDSMKLIRKMTNVVSAHLDRVEETQSAVRHYLASSLKPEGLIDATGVLEGLPRRPLHCVAGSSDFVHQARTLSRFFRNVVTLQWMTNLLGTAVKAACQRSQEMGTGWSRTEREWKKELSSETMEELVNRLSGFHQSSIFEVCRVRTEGSNISTGADQVKHMSEGLRFRLRIVCQEGAVVRDGIEIDSCASVGSMEMGEIVEAFDRCVNSSGVLRYRTRRGWVSEQTRGHGREPIAEVLSFWQSSEEDTNDPIAHDNITERVEAVVPGLRSVGASVMARVQTSYSELFSALSRVAIQGVRALPVPTISFQEGTIGDHLVCILRILASNVRNGFNRSGILGMAPDETADALQPETITGTGAAMYLGCMLSHIHACLFEEKRERRMLNLPLLVLLVESDTNIKGDIIGASDQSPRDVGIFDALKFVFEQSLVDFQRRASDTSLELESKDTKPQRPRQRVSHTVAASLPPSITLLRRLMSGPMISSSPIASILSRLKRSDLASLLGVSDQVDNADPKGGEFFHPESFVRTLHCGVSVTVRELWNDSRFVHAPPYIVHPIATLVGEIIVGLEECSKRRSSQSSRTPRSDGGLWDAFARGGLPHRRPQDGGDDGGVATEEDVFEPNEDTVTRLMEMGFSRDHALDALESTQSNRVEIAMEYALSHPPPSPPSAERRRAAREERRRERDERRRTQSDADRSSSAAHSSNDNDPSSPAKSKGDSSKISTDEEELALAKLSLQDWIKEAPRVACDLLAGCSSTNKKTPAATTDKPEVAARNNVGTGEGDAEVEALTVVLCSFLLDLGQRYPIERNGIVQEVLKRMKAQLSQDESGFCVADGMESSYASLCHAAVLFARALPKTRSLILKEGLVNCTISCLHSFLSCSSFVDQDSSQNTVYWPMWLAPALLLLDVMAQPVVAFAPADSKEEDMTDDVAEGKGELSQIEEEHKKEALALADLAKSIFSSIEKAKVSTEENVSMHTSGGQKQTTNPRTQDDAGNTPPAGLKEDAEASPFSSVPAYFPLLPLASVEPCTEICLALLQGGPAKRADPAGVPPPPPGVVHATLLLLMRLLRTPRMSSHCLRLGVAEAILSLPRQCRFTGNSGLVTLIFRHLLEDEGTLRSAMETEIRGTIAKLHRKQKNTGTEKEKISVSRRAFIQAVTPLMCRDPVSFLKALAVSVSVETPPSTSSSEPKISLLSTEERSRNIAVLSEVLDNATSIVPSSPGKSSSHRKPGSGSRCRRGSSQKHKPSSRLSFSKRKSKKEKEKSEESAPAKQAGTAATPANHITALLITSIIATSTRGNNPEAAAADDDAFSFDSSFLWTANLLEVLADLVLALPACAVAVHKYRLHRSKDRACRSSFSSAALLHALSTCPNPPKTFVNFLLHSLLPQDRWSIRKDQQIWERRKDEAGEEAEALKLKRMSAYRRTKVAQAVARLLVSLVARPGEGRRRVIADLSFALSGGHLGHASLPSNVPGRDHGSPVETELHALQAWGDLCIGLAAPRSNGINLDGNTALSFDVVKIMLEHGMSHALLFGLQRIRLNHPMSPSTCGSILMPFEILTRGSVTVAVHALAEKEASKEVTKFEPKEADVATAERDDSRGQSREQAETPAHNDEGFDGDAQNHILVEYVGNGIDEGFVMNADLDDPMNRIDYDAMIESEENGADEDVDGDEEDADMDDDEDGESDDEVMTSSGESEESSEEEDSDENSAEDEEEHGSIIEDSDDSSDEIEEDDFNMDYREDFLVEDQNFDDQEENGPSERSDPGLDEGWTRIESNGFGGMLLGGRRNMAAANGGTLTARTRGFIDAAEAMIGTLLRTGEIHSDALAEIEGSLGIRIMPNGPDFGITGRGEGGLAEAVSGRSAPSAPGDPIRRGEVVGTLPHIHQRSPPDGGFSSLGGGRWNEISSMEYVYGGPSVSAGSRNYDLISAPPNNCDSDHPNVSVDSQLFPGGPASVAHARTQHSLHPLLCGVDLPPVNSLVSDLLPHGIRSTRRGQMITRRPGDWTNSSFSTGGYLVSTSNGNIIRSNRTHSGVPLAMTSSSRGVAGPVGWTDDGLPFDATVEEFSAAFERALGDSVTQNVGRTPAASTAAPSGESEQQRAVGDEDSNHAGHESTPGSRANNAVSRAPSEDLAAPPAGAASASASASAAVESEIEGNRVTNDSDGVASSLAEGLRLSPRSEESSQSDRMSTGGGCNEAANSDALQADSVMPDVAVASRNATGADINAIADESMSVEAQAETETVPTESGMPTEVEGSPDESLERTEASATGECSNGESSAAGAEPSEPNGNGLTCPPGMDLEVFNSLPLEMQQEVVEQHRVATEVAAQLDSGSSLDPDALAALPEDMRREVIEQEQQERRMREQAPADPTNAEEMDNASFVASLAPDLREEILLTADDAFLNSLPPNIVAEAQILRERASAQHRRLFDDAGAGAVAGVGNRDGGNIGGGLVVDQPQRNGQPGGPRDAADPVLVSGSRKKQRSGKLRVESDRPTLVYLPSSGALKLEAPVAKSDVMVLLSLLYLLSPVRPQRLVQKVFQNLCLCPSLRRVLTSIFVKLLHDDESGARATLHSLENEYSAASDWRKMVDDLFSSSFKDFPPPVLIGAAPEVLDTEGLNPNITLLKRRQGSSTAASVAANLPTSARGSGNEQFLPPVVATRIVDTLLHLCKNSPRFCLDTLVREIICDGAAEGTNSTCFDRMIDLLEKPRYSKSSANLEQLLSLLESAVSPLSHITRHAEDDQEVSQKEIEAASAAGKEWVDVPRLIVSQERLQLLCSILRMESCRDTAFTKVNTIARRLCRVEANRGYILAELASVAHALGANAVRDLRALKLRMDEAAALHQDKMSKDSSYGKAKSKKGLLLTGSASNSVTLSTSSSELKLLRVLQTLQALCSDTSDDGGGKKNENSVVVTEELVHLLHAMSLNALWDELTACLKVVQVLEGVTSLEDSDEKKTQEGENEDDGSDENGTGGKKLQNSVAGLLTRFLPSIEAFFVANASSTRDSGVGKKTKAADSDQSQTQNTHEDGTTEQQPMAGARVTNETNLENLVGGKRVVQFVATNKVLLNALIRNNPSLLDKGLRSLVQVVRCRGFLDFDVKRQWFKTQVRRLRQHASRRHGSLRLHIRRKHVFEDAYHQLRLRNADEVRGRLHITFRNEEGVDAGGLSREFFGILAKEIFNPNYALFTSTEDGCTFQPNPNSSINPDHLSYFRFVGRIVGKAVADGFLLDAHFTRSLYKHMLGLKPTHHDMEAIDPDYYKNLKTILEYNLADIGLDLTFSIEDHSFGRSQIIDLVPNGRNIPVTEESKSEYVSLVCQHRMTTAISNQIKAYLDGFYELVSPELIAVFTPRELELLISGLPDIDIHNLKQNTEYVGWKATDGQIHWFWNIMTSLSRSEKAAFLQFVTGSAKVPLGGFSELQGMRGVQKFSIHKTGGSSGALMSAHTCFNSLDLPVYKSEEEMREKLIYAINEGTGSFMFA